MTERNVSAVIIEDEYPAAERLQQLLQPHAEVQVQAVLDSVNAGVNYFTTNPAPDLIFSDVQLGDGLSFEIFDQVPPVSPIVFTTSYDEYALRAFGLYSLDYLLKPIKADDLARAIGKFRTWRGQSQETQTADVQNQLTRLAQLLDNLPKNGAAVSPYRQRFLVESGDQLVPVNVTDIAYCYTSNELVYLVRTDGRRHVLPFTMEELAAQLDPNVFFRLNRQFIAPAGSIQKLTSALGGRLKLQLQPNPPDEVIVSRDKAGLLKQWLEQH